MTLTPDIDIEIVITPEVWGDSETNMVALVCGNTEWNWLTSYSCTPIWAENRKHLTARLNLRNTPCLHWGTELEWSPWWRDQEAGIWTQCTWHIDTGHVYIERIQWIDKCIEQKALKSNSRRRKLHRIDGFSYTWVCWMGLTPMLLARQHVPPRSRASSSQVWTLLWLGAELHMNRKEKKMKRRQKEEMNTLLDKWKRASAWSNLRQVNVMGWTLTWGDRFTPVYRSSSSRAGFVLIDVYANRVQQ